MSKKYLRRATIEDIDLLFTWANDETTRQNAFNTQQITYKEHQQWFKAKLESDNSIIYIYCTEDTAIGQVRIEIDKDQALISYSIDIAHRAQGHGSKIVEILEETIKTELPATKKLIAKVKKENIPSQRIFEKLSYKRIEKDDYIEYEKSI